MHDIDGVLKNKKGSRMKRIAWICVVFPFSLLLINQNVACGYGYAKEEDPLIKALKMKHFVFSLCSLCLCGFTFPRRLCVMRRIRQIRI